ncbi:rhomboid family protein [Anaeromyxobacter oryzae]|uniref:Peptidase S54 rhomboid domain-containing protein n=1 Tax=Anaeromyxobacter oryzae TaxID=2918170 RepID=A0ABN6MYX5_9BACT|nr:rhomboid family intramembrane serine protease [Anaeromyxobacter oryzae]BDG05836.1 hypothetical protein AMOR_48320 [Anaeromyxobacter oryzae]
MQPEPAPAAPSPPARAPRPTPVSWALLAANIAVFIWVSSHGSTTDVATLIRYGALERNAVWSGQWWRLVTAAFLHVGVFHLTANMVFGIPWCRQIERVFGPARFATLYFGSAIAGSAASLLGPATVSAGASGALFGVIGAALALHRRALGSWGEFFRNRGSQQVLLNLAVLAVVGKFVPIDQFAHLGGFLTGAAWGWIATRPWPRRTWPWIALAGAVAIVVALALYPRWRATVRAQEEIANALQRRDVPSARALLDAARGDKLDTPGLDFQEAQIRALEGDLEGALAKLEPLEKATEGEGRSEVSRLLAEVERVLGTRLVLGAGLPADPGRGRKLLDDACQRGNAKACSTARELAPVAP